MDRRHRRWRQALRSSVVFTVAFAAACGDVESRDAPATEPAAPDTIVAPDTSGQAPAITEERPQRRTIPAGTTFAFAVTESVSTSTHEPGDRFTATLRSNVDDVEGVEVLSEGATSEWVVEEATEEGDETLLAVRLESMEVGGSQRPVTATVTEADIRSDGSDTGSETAAKIGVGTAAGALIGQVLGRDTRSTLTGAGVGAAVGAVVALSTRGGSATLPAGSQILVRLEEPLIVS